jgi:hypothetical protein
MWNHPDFLILFSAGNDGPFTNTIGSPGTAKDILTSGAGENEHPGYSMDNVADFSSNGPTDDSRIKPTVIAPGDYVNSADNDFNISSFNCGIRTMNGTSMSCPTTAGLATLIRQYFTDGYYPSGLPTPADGFAPSAALIKAILVNSAIQINGAYTDGPIPSTGQGWGRVLADNALYFDGDTRELVVVDETAGLTTGQVHTFNYFADGAHPFKATLVWTDYPGSPVSSISLVNDLNLTVVAPDSTTYRGNVFTAGESSPGGSADDRNVVENVLLLTPQSGTYNITVEALNVPLGPQPYALVVTGVAACSSEGDVRLDKSRYALNDTVNLRLSDCDLDTNPGAPDIAAVDVTSTTEGVAETVLLTETGDSSGVFTGSIAVAPGVPAPDGTLQVAAGDTITVEYVDASPPATVTDTALADGSPPIISNVESHTDALGVTALISWITNEDASARVYYGTSPALGLVVDGTQDGTTAEVNLTSLTPSAIYYFDVESTDAVGNITRDDNGGAHYTFDTSPPEIEVLPANYAVTVHQGQILPDVMTISNLSGGADLTFKISDSKGISPVVSNVAIFQDRDPWGYTSVKDILAANGIPYIVYSSADMGAVNLGPYDKVIIPSQQPYALYSGAASNSAWFETYVSAGGILEFHGAEWSVDDWSALTMPGGLKHTNSYPDQLTIGNPTNPMVTTPHLISDSEIDGWNTSAHGVLSAWNGTADIVITDDISTGPVLIEFPFGAGKIIASMMTLEWAHGQGYSNIVENIVLYGGADVPWVSESPEQGVVPPGGSDIIAVTFDARGMATGIYDANIIIKNDDPDENPTIVPASMTVTASADLAYSSHVIDDDLIGESNGDGDGFVEPGEDIELAVTLENTGSLAGSGLSGVISSPHPEVTILDADELFPDIPVGGTGATQDDFGFSVGGLVLDGEEIPFDLDVTDGSLAWYVPFTVTVENKSSIMGQVIRQSTGAPILGAVVTATGPETGSATSLIDGTYRIDGLTSGTYTVTCTAASQEDGVPQTVILPPDATGVDFYLDDLYTIDGIVLTVPMNETVAGAVVDYTGPDSGSVNTGPNGLFAISELSAGHYDLVATYPGIAHSGTAEVDVPPNASGLLIEIPAPSMSVTPGSIEVTVLPGDTANRILNISNIGGGSDGEFWISGGSGTSSLVINEFNNGNSDWVELYNGYSSPIDLVGWQLYWTDTRGYDGTIVLPSFIIQPGNHVELNEGTCAPTPTRLCMDSNITWVGTDGGSAAIIDPSIVGVDFVRWGGSNQAPPAGTNWTETSPLPTPPETQSMGRDSSSTDTDHETDWTIYSTPSPGGPNSVSLLVVPWLSHYPDSGTVPAGDSVDVTVAFDSSGQVEGRYESELNIDTDDPAHPEFVVPVAMTVTTGAYLYVSSFNVDDDGVGESAGNGNGLIEPGESIELAVSISNSGFVDASNVITGLFTLDPYVMVSDSLESFGNIAVGGQMPSTDDFDFTIDPATPNNHEFTLDFLIMDDSFNLWGDSITLIVKRFPPFVLDPWSLVAAALPGGTVSQPLIITNTGGLSEDFTIYLGDPGSGGGGGFQDDMESGVGDWEASGLWHLTSTSDTCGLAHSPTHAWYYGSPFLCNYDVGVTNGSLVSPAFVVPEGGLLKYWSWESTEGNPTMWDLRLVYISTNGGATWTQIHQSLNESASWYEVMIDISAYAGETAKLRFYFDSLDDVANDYPGWYIDDVVVEGSGGPPAPVPDWLSVSPDSGSLAPGSSVGVTVHYDATTISVGIYTSSLWVVGSDPSEDPIEVPVTFNVLSSPLLFVSSFTVDDDMTGESFGNANNILEPGETAELVVEIANYGGVDAIAVTGVLSTTDGRITVNDDTETFGDLPPISTVFSPDDYDFSVDPGASDFAAVFTLLLSETGMGLDFQRTIVVPVRRTPEFDFFPPALAVTVAEGGTASWPVRILNLGTLDLSIQTSGSDPWIFAVPPSGTVVPGDSLGLFATVDATHLVMGTTTGAVTLITNDVDEGTATVTVYVTVIAGVNPHPNSCLIDDASFVCGLSDGDGYFEPGECVDLYPIITNMGHLDGSSITATITCDDPAIRVIRGIADYGDLPALTDVSPPTPFQVKADVSHTDARDLDFQMVITDSAGTVWNRSFQVRLENSFGFTGTVTEINSGVAIAGAEVTYRDGPVQGTVTAQADGSFSAVGLPAGSYNITLSHPGFTGTPVSLLNLPPDNPVIQLTMSGPVIAMSPPSQTIVFIDGLPTGEAELTMENLGGGTLMYALDDATPPAGYSTPDAYGYQWIDSLDPDGPSVAYDDLSLSGASVQGLGDDSNVGPFPLGFDFNFYGTTVDEVRISSNGYLSFTDPIAQFLNLPLPDPGAPDNLLAILWSDLTFNAGGQVRWMGEGRRWTADFIDPVLLGGMTPSRFEAVLDQSGDFMYRYSAMGSAGSEATIGIQNQDGSIGLTAAHMDPGLPDSYSVVFTKAPSGLRKISPAAGSLSGGQSTQVTFYLDLGLLPLPGRFSSISIDATGNDVLGLPASIGLTLVLDLSPSITSSPGTQAWDNTLYLYDVEASDPDGDTVYFSLDQGPSGMGIDSVTGLIDFTPGFSQVGEHSVEVSAIDVYGADVLQSFTLTVSYLDQDDDGLPDTWEQSVGLDPGDSIGDNGAGGDPDGDGLVNLEEWENGLDPLVSNAPTAPSINFPSVGSEVADDTPLLSLNNSSDPDGDSLVYEFEVYEDPALTILAGATAGVTEGMTTTNWEVPVELADHGWYYWRARATDGLAIGPWMLPGSFRINLANDPPGTVSISSPADGSQVAETAPTLEVTETADPDGDPLVYFIEVFEDSERTITVDISPPLPEEGDGDIAWTVSVNLGENQWYYWSAWAEDDEGLQGPEAFADFQVNATNLPPFPPILLSPSAGDEIQQLDPPLIVNNTLDPDQDAVSYQFQIDSQNNFSSPDLQDSGYLPEIRPYTAWYPATLADNTMYYWQARATDGSAASSWSEMGSFMVNMYNDAPTAPTPQEPGDGVVVSQSNPCLVAIGATDTDGDSLTYCFEVCEDAAMSVPVEAFDGVVPDGNVAEWVINTGLEDGRTYYWRAWAVDEHDLAGPACAPVSFQVVFSNSAPVGIRAISPRGGMLVGSQQPELIVANASDPDGDSLVYDFQIFDSPDLGSMIDSAAGAPETSEETSWIVSLTLEQGMTYYWRARAFDGAAYSSWTATSSFSVNPGSAPNLTVVKKKEGDRTMCGMTGNGRPARNQALAGIILPLLIWILVRRRI